MINKIINGDCLEVMKDIEDKSIDMILCDLPYGTTACKWDSIIDLEPMWKQLKRLIKPNGAIVMTASQPFTTTLISSNMKMFKYCWVWDKDRSCGSFMAKKRPLKYHEDVVIFYKKQPTYNPQMTTGRMQNKASGGKSDNYGDIPIIRYMSDQYYPRSIQTFKACHNMTGKVHPTQKPVALMEYLIKTYTNENETVLDFTMGSGTTGVACKNLNRDFIGIELDEKYCEIAKKRLEDNKIQKTLI